MVSKTIYLATPDDVRRFSKSDVTIDKALEMPEEDVNLVLGALDSLGTSLADHDHQWTEGERVIYEEACRVLGRPTQPEEDWWKA